MKRNTIYSLFLCIVSAILLISNYIGEGNIAFISAVLVLSVLSAYMSETSWKEEKIQFFHTITIFLLPLFVVGAPIVLGSADISRDIPISLLLYLLVGFVIIKNQMELRNYI